MTSLLLNGLKLIGKYKRYLIHFFLIYIFRNLFHEHLQQNIKSAGPKNKFSFTAIMFKGLIL